jgi:hypothetical protein
MSQPDDSAPGVLVGFRSRFSRPSAVAALVLAAVIALGGLAFGTWRLSQGGPGAPALSGLQSSLYSCAGALFDPSANHGDTGAERGGDAQSNVLRATFDRLPGSLPAVGWLRLTPSEEDVLFVAAGSKTLAPYVFVDVRTAGTGSSAYAYGDCEPAVPPAVNDATFDFAAWYTGPLSPSDQTIGIMLQSNYCDETYVGPTTWYAGSSVTATFWARRATPPTPQGSLLQACPLYLQFRPATLTLAEPLGDRQLMMGPASAARLASPTP